MAVIEFERVSKVYRLGTGRTSLRETIALVPRRLFSQDGARPVSELLWALNDVSFRVEPGEVLGIIGPNGAGKSTILKLLSKVTFPTSGRIRTRGRMAALIELGAGFHPDLSGRENIYLNGVILGLKRREIDARLSNIVEFAELEKFIDTPVKRYSSGMYVRLAFSIAAHVKADLLLVDEVLSVGDMAFQQKCLNRMNQLRDSGATIVFISHNMWSVEKFCGRALFLRAGQIQADGDPKEIVAIYRRQETEAMLSGSNSGVDVALDAAAGPQDGAARRADEAAITQVELLNEAGQPKQAFNSNDPLIVRAHYIAPEQIETPLFVIQIRRPDGLICCAKAGRNDEALAQQSIHSEGTFEARVGPLRLVPGIYTMEAHIVDREKPIVYASSSRETFHVKGRVPDSDFAGVFEPDVEWLPRE